MGPLSRNREALIPQFQIVRSAPGARIVLVADVSGSMQNHVILNNAILKYTIVSSRTQSLYMIQNRIQKLNESVRSWIKHDLPVGSQLGLIQFRYRTNNYI